MNMPLEKIVMTLERVSLDQQAGPDRAGLDRQRECNRRTIEAYGLRCVGNVVLKNVSGSSVRRAPEIQELLRKIECREIGGIVVADLDRLGRTTRFEDFALFQAFQNSNGAIYTSAGPIFPGSDDGFFSSVIKSAMDGMELQRIRKRMLGGKEEFRKKGLCAGSKITLPLGVDYDRPAQKFLYVSPEIDRVREAFRLVDEQGMKNYCEIARRTRIKATSLKNILRNPIYAGTRVYDTKRGTETYRSVDGRQPERKKIRRRPEEVISVKVFDQPAVDPARFKRVQKILSETNRRWKEIRSHKTGVIFLAGGIAFCDFCGSPLYGSAHPRKNGTVLSYYRCRSNTPRHRERTGGCQFAHMRRIDIDAALVQLTDAHLSQPEMIRKIIEHALESTRSRLGAGKTPEEMQAMLEKMGRRRMRLIDAYEKELLSLEEFERRLDAVQREENTVRSWLGAESGKPEADVDKLARRISRGALAFKRIKDPADQKRAIDQLFSRITFRGNKIISFSLRPQFAHADTPPLECQPSSRS